MLKRIENLKEFEWLEARLTNTEKPLITAVIPSGFEAYCKILHPIYQNLDVEDTAVSWDSKEKSETICSDSPMDKILKRATLVYSTSTGEENVESVSWREVAEKYGVDYTPDMNQTWIGKKFENGSWPDYLYGPSEGSIDRPILDYLVETIKKNTNTRDCYFFYVCYATNFEHGYDDLLFEGSLEDVIEISNHEYVRGTPTLWWDSQHSWCVGTDWDLTFSIVAGSSKMIDEILKCHQIESFRIDPHNTLWIECPSPHAV